jgi:hypothetical protein
MDIVRALQATGGLVYLASKSLNCTANTIYTRAKKSRLIRQAIQGPRGELVDVAESRLRSAVLAGDPRARNFVLSTLGKKRGYVKAKEVRHSGIPSKRLAPPGAEDVVRIQAFIAVLASHPRGDAGGAGNAGTVGD